MPQLNWNVILMALLYAALTGILNLVLARKSQIEAWSESNPKLAAVLKLLRAIGVDPWQIIASASLLFRSKLPAIQKSSSPIAQLEQRKADAKALRDNDRDPPGDSPVEGVPYSVRPAGGMDAEMRALPVPVFALLGVLALLAWPLVVACAPPPIQPDVCSKVSLATIVAGCKARAGECAQGDDTCPLYLECKRAVAAWKDCK